MSRVGALCWVKQKRRAEDAPLGFLEQKLPERERFKTEKLKKDVCTWKEALRQDPPLDFSFWSFLTCLHHGIGKVERHLL